jgi:hypothetical protein
MFSVSPSLLNYIGIGAGMAGSVCFNLGNNLVALAAHRDDPGRLQTVGWVVFTIGSLLEFGAFSIAAAAVVAPLESLQFVVHLAFNRLVNNVALTCRMVGGTALILIGTAVVVYSGPRDPARATPLETLEGYWASPIWLCWLAALMVLTVAADAVYRCYTRALRSGREPWRSELVLPVAYALASAPLGTQVQVMSKGLGAALKLVITSGGVTSPGALAVFESWYLYTTAVVLLCSGSFWISRLNYALQAFDPVVAIPLLQALFILFATASGGLYFDEFRMLSLKHAVFFSGGVAVELAGLAMLTHQSEPAAPPKHLAAEADAPAEETAEGASVGAVMGAADGMTVEGTPEVVEGRNTLGVRLRGRAVTEQGAMLAASAAIASSLRLSFSLSPSGHVLRRNRSDAGLREPLHNPIAGEATTSPVRGRHHSSLT